MLKKTRKYNKALLSTIIVGGSQASSFVFGLIRNKTVAIYIGPSGVGIISVYANIIELVVGIFICGIQVSGIREIAKLKDSNYEDELGSLIASMLGLSWVLATLGALFIITFAPYLSSLFFNNGQQTNSIYALSLAVFVSIIYYVKVAIMQAFRNVINYGKMIALSSFFGSVLFSIIVILYGVNYIALALSLQGAVGLLFCYFFSRQYPHSGYKKKL